MARVVVAVVIVAVARVIVAVALVIGMVVIAHRTSTVAGATNPR